MRTCNYRLLQSPSGVRRWYLLLPVQLIEAKSVMSRLLLTVLVRLRGLHPLGVRYRRLRLLHRCVILIPIVRRLALVRSRQAGDPALERELGLSGVVVRDLALAVSSSLRIL